MSLETTTPPVEKVCQTQDSKGSWVWNHFIKINKEVEKGGTLCNITFAVCQYTIRKNGVEQPCGQEYSISQKAGTSNLSRHLSQTHLISKNGNPQKGTMKSYIKNGYFKEVCQN